MLRFLRNLPINKNMFAQNAVKGSNVTNFRFAGRLRRMSSRNDVTVFHLRRKSYAAEPNVVSGKLNPASDSSLPFARAKVGPFFQAQPKLGNQFLEDITLQKYLRRHLPNKVINRFLSTLRSFRMCSMI
jgi:hypothetical protein